MCMLVDIGTLRHWLGGKLVAVQMLTMTRGRADG